VTAPRILDRRLAWQSPFVRVVEKEVDLGGPRGVQTFWSVRTNGYVAVVAVTPDLRIPLVRQYRPALEMNVLELPSGAIDPGEAPEEAARRELLEESGCEAGELISLGQLHVDSGRMETQQWGFFAPDARVVREHPTGEEELELTFVTGGELRDLIKSGEFNLAAHVAMVGLAVLSGRLTL
jgi:8-oxo-dGTP pyrophosphatase MutT (NUDIX family)